LRRRGNPVWVTLTVALLACAGLVVRVPTAVTAGLGLALFAAPGYLLEQLLPGPRRVGLERLAVSAGLAFCVPIIGGLLLFLARVRLDRASWLGLLAGVTVSADLLMFLRQRRKREGQPVPPSARWQLRAGPSVAFGVAVLVAAGAVGLARAGASAQHYPGFTQLWLVHPDAAATTANLGVSNDEGVTIRYQLVLLRDGRVADRWNLTLRNGQVWRRSPRFSNNIAAHLYRLPGSGRPYREVGIGRDRRLLG
jgi:hypothetical protein